MLLLRVRPRARGEQPAPTGSVIEDLRAGWREVRSRVWVWATIAAFTGTLFCVFAQWYALAPGDRARRGTAAPVCSACSRGAAGAGAVIGAVMAPRGAPGHPLRSGLTALCVAAVDRRCSPSGTRGAGGRGDLHRCLGSGDDRFWESALAHHVPPHVLRA